MADPTSAAGTGQSFALLPTELRLRVFRSLIQDHDETQGWRIILSYQLVHRTWTQAICDEAIHCWPLSWITHYCPNDRVVHVALDRCIAQLTEQEKRIQCLDPGESDRSEGCMLSPAREALVSAVFPAVLCGRATHLRKMLAIDKAFANLREENTSMLHYAVDYRRLHCVELLLDAGACLEEQAWYGAYFMTPLARAVNMQSQAIAIFLLTRGANSGATPTTRREMNEGPDLEDDISDSDPEEAWIAPHPTLLATSMRHGLHEVVSVIIQDHDARGIDWPKTQSLFEAIYDENVRIAAILIDHFLKKPEPPDLEHLSRRFPENSQTENLPEDKAKERKWQTFLTAAICYAARWGKAKIIRLLVERGAKISPRVLSDMVSYQASIKVITSLYRTTYRELMESGIKQPNLLPEWHYKGVLTPMEIAIHTGDIEMVRLALDNGASADTFPDDLGGPLLLAIYYDESEMALLLLERGAHMWKNALGELDDHLELAKTIFTNSPSQRQEMLNDIVVGYRSNELARACLECGGDPNAQLEGWPLLSIVARHPTERGTDLLRIFLEFGADPNPDVPEYKTPLYEAKRCQRDKNAALLLEHMAVHERKEPRPRVVTPQDQSSSNPSSSKQTEVVSEPEPPKKSGSPRLQAQHQQVEIPDRRSRDRSRRQLREFLGSFRNYRT